MAGKRLQLAQLMMATGLHSLVPNGISSLLVLNYHRIRNPGQRTSPFDDGVFDTDFETFRRQMQWLRAATQVLDETSLLKLDSYTTLPRNSIFSAVTFDDGYIDCFTLVKPVLDELGIRGMFFVPVAILESRGLGWWDIAAFMLKHSQLNTITVDGRQYPLGAHLNHSLMQLLKSFKLESADATSDLLEKISHACGVAPPGKDLQSAELMNWTQVCQLRDAGHSIGSHAWSHRVLATLRPEEQSREIHDSRRELRAIVGDSVLSFAYPVGGHQHFDEHSVRLVREAGYEQAFTFNTGIANLPMTDRFRIPRESAKSLPLLKAKALLPGLMGLRARRAV